MDYASAHYSPATIRAAYHVVGVAEDDMSYEGSFGQTIRPETRNRMRRAKDILTRACLTKDQSRWLAFVAGRILPVERTTY